MANKYIIVGSTLFRRGFNGEFLRCLTGDEAHKVVGEAHSGACGGHVNGPMLAKKNTSTELLMANHGRRLRQICSSLREVSTPRKQDPRTRIFSPSIILTLPFSM